MNLHLAERSPKRLRPLPMPSSWSIKLAGTCRPVSSCPQISPSLRCRQNAPSSIRSKTSGSLCATTGSRTASSNPTTISSTIAATLGTSSSISPGASCPSDCANGRTGSDQWELVLGAMRPDLPDEVEVTTKKQLNGEARPDLIARTGSNILYREKQPAPVLLDFDQKGMPPEVRERFRPD